MASIEDQAGQRLLEQRNHAVCSTMHEDGSVDSTVVWADAQDGRLAVDSAVGRRWPSDLERDPRITVVGYDETDPHEYVEVRGTATGRTEGADDHIDARAKYLGADSHPFRRPDEQRITDLVEPGLVRHRKQG